MELIFRDCSGGPTLGSGSVDSGDRIYHQQCDGMQINIVPMEWITFCYHLYLFLSWQTLAARHDADVTLAQSVTI